MAEKATTAAEPRQLIAGADPSRPLDILLVSAPLRNYSVRPRVNDFTLPVLGMAYIATCAAQAGYNAGVLDAEANGLGIAETAHLVNEAAPRWAGFALLAPTYEVSAVIAASLDPAIKVMLGGHQAKAMPAHRAHPHRRPHREDRRRLPRLARHCLSPRSQPEVRGHPRLLLLGESGRGPQVRPRTYPRPLRRHC
jgi:hypothetical protein